MSRRANTPANAIRDRSLQAGWLQRLSAQSSIYSVVTVAVLLLFALLGAFELLETDITAFEVGLSIGILVVCLGIGVVVLMGVALPYWFGLALVVVHALVSVYYLGFSNERQNAIAALQELPVMAMYLGGLYSARVARFGGVVVLVAHSSAMLLGPFGGDGGVLGPANLVGAVLFSWFCLETGLFVQRRVRLESHADALTGVLNRRGFISEAKRHIRGAARAGSAVSIALLDLDDFKMVNDAAGHAAGDDVLRALASEWVSRSRPDDVVARLGGDEFAMILPATDAEDAVAVMRRLRAETTHPWSWGVTQLVAGDTVDQALARADAAMYSDKRNQPG